MDKAVAAVRHVNLNHFLAMSWRQVAFDMDRHAHELDVGQLPRLLELVINAPTPVVNITLPKKKAPTPRRNMPKVRKSVAENWKIGF